MEADMAVKEVTIAGITIQIDGSLDDWDDFHWRWFPDGIDTGIQLLDYLGVLQASHADQKSAVEGLTTSRLPCAPKAVHDDLVQLGLWDEHWPWHGGWTGWEDATSESERRRHGKPSSPARQLDVAAMDDSGLLSVWAAAMGELRRRGLVRSSNNPVADYAEWLVADRLDLALEPPSMSGYDAKGPDGARYQIKARRLLSKRTSRQLGAIRNLDQDPFDFLVVAFFDEHFGLMELWRFPIELVRDHAAYRKHVNAHVLHAQGAVLADPRAVRLA